MLPLLTLLALLRPPQLRLLPLRLPTQLGIETSAPSPDKALRTEPPDRLLLTAGFRLTGEFPPGRRGSNGGGGRERVALFPVLLPGDVGEPVPPSLPPSSAVTVAAGALFKFDAFPDSVVVAAGAPRVPPSSSSVPSSGEESDARAVLWGGGGNVKGAAAAAAAAAATVAMVEAPRRSSSDCSRYDGWLRSSLMRCFFALGPTRALGGR